MSNFQDTLETRSFISAFSICVIVPLKELPHYSHAVNILFSAGIESLNFLPILFLLES